MDAISAAILARAGQLSSRAWGKGDGMGLRRLGAFCAALLIALVAGGTSMSQPARPEALTVEAPPIPSDLPGKIRPYTEARSAIVADWNPADRELLILTRFADTAQLHSVAVALGARRQLTFEADRIAGAVANPRGGSIVVQKDVGGDEFFQLYTLADGRLRLITDGKSRNLFGAFSRDGRWVGYSSTRRNGVDSDLYVIDPSHPATDHLVLKVEGGGWSIDAFSNDEGRALVSQYISAARSVLYLLDLATGALKPITDPAAEIAWRDAQMAPDGTIWVTSDADSDALRLGRLDPAARKFEPVTPAGRWDVEQVALAEDGLTLAYAVNEAGVSRLHILDVRSGRDRLVEALPPGVIMAMSLAPWGPLAVTVSGPRAGTDIFVVDPHTLAVSRWTLSETGGLDPERNAAAELVTIPSFDREPVSGFLFRPDPVRFPGPRPLIINIHGGPEGQSRPTYLGSSNYLINELGLAVFYPNVRGSSGFGKRFLALDNGPFRREDTVKDIGAFIDRFVHDPGIDPRRIGVTGGSYGGYMTLAALTHYSDRLRAGIEIVGISNFVTFLENTQAYRRDLRRVEYGDERDPVQRAKLIEISPLTRADRIRVPLMVVTGANDPRVPASEAAQIIAAVKAHGLPVWSILAANEGHGFARKENQDYATLVQIMFWERFLLAPQ